MINLVTALPAEAAPIIKHWRLKKSNRTHPFTLFCRDDIRLVVSGIGKCNSAAATAWLAGIESSYRQRNSVWLNIGIAGHAALTTGTLVCANRVLDASTRQSWYPTLINNPFTKAGIQTVDQPVSDYPAELVVEMEASGFYPTALKITTSELAQCFKVVSDNTANPLSAVTADTARTLIGDHLSTVENQLQVLLALAAHCDATDTSDIELLFESQWRFSATQKSQLQRLLQRQLAITGDTKAATDLFQELSGGRHSTPAVLAQLHNITSDVSTDETN